MEDDKIKINIPRKEFKKILDFFSLYFQKVFLYIKKKELIFFNNENETQLTLIISLPFDASENMNLPTIPYMLGIKKTLAFISIGESDYVDMFFEKIGYGFVEKTNEHNYRYFKKNKLDQVLDFKKDKKVISKFVLNDRFNIFTIHNKTEEYINFKLETNKVLFFFKNEDEENELEYPLKNKINLVNDVGKNSYFINILFLRFVSKITKLNKNKDPIICSIMCDKNQHYIPSIKISFWADSYKITAFCKVTHNQ